MAMTYQQKSTFGDMRASGVRDVLSYCRDHRCSHHVETSADGLGRRRPAVRHRAGLRLHRLRSPWCRAAAEVFAGADGDWLDGGGDQSRSLDGHTETAQRKGGH